MTTTDSEVLLNCSYAKILSAQNEYDSYYKLAKSKNDETFYHGFLMAINRCGNNLKNHECKLKDEQAYNDFINNCAKNYIQVCVKKVLVGSSANHKFSQNEKINMFNKSLEKNMSEGYVCLLDSEFQIFYNSLNNNEKYMINNNIKKYCNL